MRATPCARRGERELAPDKRKVEEELKALEIKRQQLEQQHNQLADEQSSSGRWGISEQTFYRWKKVYGGLEPGQARRLKQLEEENAKLKRLVADLSLIAGTV